MIVKDKVKVKLVAIFQAVTNRMLQTLVICFCLLLVLAFTSAGYPECREGEKEGILRDCEKISHKMLLRGRFACPRWNVMWKAAERGGASVAGFSNPGSSTHPQEIQLGSWGIGMIN